MKIEEARQMENILISFLGEPKTRYENELEGQRIFNCPKCAEENGGIPDGKYNLEINLSKNLAKGGVFQCWRCSSIDNSMKGDALKLVKKYGGVGAYNSYRELISSIRTSKLYNLDELGINETENDTEELKLPESFKKIVLKTCKNKSVVQYLRKRHIDQWTINKFNIGYTEKDENGFSYRIIVPSYNEFGQLNYFVGRDYLPENKNSEFIRPKYKNCNVDKKSIVFQEKTIDWDGDIYICEGALDCLMVPNGLSLLGKTLQKDSELYKTLYNKANANVIICLDADTDLKETKEIYKLLDSGRLKGKIKYIRLGETGTAGKDFSEIFEKNGMSGIAKTLKKEKKFNETDLIF